MDSAELSEIKGRFEDARPGTLETRDETCLSVGTPERLKQKDTELRESQGNNLAFLEVSLVAARLPIRKLNFQAAPYDNDFSFISPCNPSRY